MAPDDELVVVRRGPGLAVLVSVGLLALLLVVLIGAWLARKPIATHFIESELDRRGVRATYTLDSIGLHDQVVRDLVIGDPARPDLTARYAKIQMRFKWDGSVAVYRVVGRGVRLKGRLLPSGRVSWGDIDRLLPPPSGKPFRLPDVAVDLKDATIALQTPYGRLGLAVAGAGNLTGGFKGRLAVAGRRLDLGACSLDSLAGNVALAVEARRPLVNGPIRAASLTCPASRMAMTAPRLDLDSRFSEGFDRFEGKGRMAVAAFTAGDNGLANLVANIGFDGSARNVGGHFDLAAQRARLASIFADRTRMEGDYRLRAGAGRLAVVADYAASSASVAAPTLAAFLAPLRAAAGTPLAPVATAIAAAIERTGRDFEVAGKLRLINFPGGGGVRIDRADISGPAGAEVRIVGSDGVDYYWPSGRVRIDGQISTNGGGLPRAEVALRQPRVGGGMSGEARVAPYSAGGARLAMAPIRFRPASGGTEVHTVALMDGPFAGGRVTGLRIPIDGRIGAGGGFAFGQDCVTAAFQSLKVGALRLGAARIPLCAAAGAIVSKGPGGPLRVGAVTNNLRLGGSLGKSPFRLAAAQARLLAADRFALKGLGVQLGRSEAPVRIAAATLDGRLARGGAAGQFGGGSALIGRVPLKLSDARGAFDFHGGRLAIKGSSMVSDLAPNPRFYPLVSNELNFLLANDRIHATGGLRHPASGTLVTNVTIDHRLSTGDGQALLDVPGIRFVQGGLQPDQLTRLTEGVIALVNGTITGQGRINWTGSGRVTSTGDFSTDGTDLAALFGPVTGLRGTIHFTDLLALESAPGQRLQVASVNPGILVQDGEIHYQLLPGQLVRIERGEWPFMGGRLILQETVLNFGRPSPKRLTFEVAGLDAKTFVDSMGFKEIQATGIFDGVLPMIFDDSGGRIVGGRLDARPGGGSLSYNGVVNKADLGTMGNIAFNALRDLRFKSMIIRLDGDLAGEFATKLTIDGVALGQSTGTQKIIKGLLAKIPIKMNVSIVGPFRSLIALAKSFRDPRAVIRDVLPAPIDQIPGIVTEVRNRSEQKQQSQTPVTGDVKLETQPPPSR